MKIMIRLVGYLRLTICHD